MKKRIFLLIAVLGLFSAVAQAGRVDTVMVPSPSMNKNVRVVYVQPDKAMAGERCPVVYVLHGFSGDATNWVTKKPELVQIADEKGMIFVCPDGNDSWYWDSPVDPAFRYETFVAKELVKFTDDNYSTIADRKARAITGLSMGGHGALFLSMRHKDTFGAAGSMSGGVDIRPFPKSWKMSQRLGAKAENLEVWNAHTVMNQLDRIASGDLALTIDCGVDDFFYKVNVALHEQLLARKIDHDFTIRPGGHTWKYWVNSIDFHLLFFEKFFKEAK